MFAYYYKKHPLFFKKTFSNNEKQSTDFSMNDSFLNTMN